MLDLNQSAATYCAAAIASLPYDKLILRYLGDYELVSVRGRTDSVRSLPFETRRTALQTVVPSGVMRWRLGKGKAMMVAWLREGSLRQAERIPAPTGVLWQRRDCSKKPEVERLLDLPSFVDGGAFSLKL